MYPVQVSGTVKDQNNFFVSNESYEGRESERTSAAKVGRHRASPRPCKNCVFIDMCDVDVNPDQFCLSPSQRHSSWA